MLVAVRMNSKTETQGDNLAKYAQVLPLEPVMSSFMFNSQMLYELNRYRSQNNSGTGEPIVEDENHASNGQMSILMILIHCAVFWFILIFFIELQLCSICCCNRRVKQLSTEDNDEFISQMIKS